MRVSIVVPAFNEEKLIAQSLAAIRAASAAFAQRGWDVELIVCDNNSTDGTAALAREAGASVVFEPLNQISRARNAGAAHARGDWLVFVDADSWPTRELFDDAAQAIESGDCLAGGATVHYDTARLDVRLPLAAWNAVSRLLKWAAGCFIFCEAAAFREAGGFSQALYAGEEIELFRRLKTLARARRRRIVILHRHPLLSSDRKVKLYRVSEMRLFLVRMAASRGRSLRTRDACQPWYDGRR
ncbi:MAG: glycosyltransferase [Betaproteobacteria bacterium]|nr:MAG: glycosyltransferase [Betaproteobacteria bacterium]TMH40698.1 MAG: glycosyltransferase [Betaproteobacteria bacterium]